MLVTVVGGGISGLSAAYELHRRGVPFVLHEASPRLGGIVRTEYTGTFVIDAGPDAILARKRAGIQLCEELGIADRLVPATPPRVAFILRNGELQPISATLMTSGRGDVAGEDESIASFFARRFGREAVDYFAEPLLAGIHAGDVDRLSIRALFPELLEPRQGSEPPDPDGAFRSFPRGMQELVGALAASLPAEAVRTGTPVRSLRDGLADGPVIVATPAAIAADLVEPLDAELAALCRAIPYVSSGIAVLAYPRTAVAHPLQGSGFVVPRVERGTRILAATWLSSKWPGRAPAGLALMRAFLGGARDPGILLQTDDAIIALAHQDLARLLNIAAEPTFARVYRWHRATPQYEVGYLDRLKLIRARAARHPGLHLTGAGFGSIGIPDCIEAGRSVARQVAERPRDTY